MNINNVPLKYLTKKQAQEYKAVRKERKLAEKRNQILFNRLVKFFDIAEAQVKEILKVKYLDRYYRDFNSSRFIHVTGARSENCLEVTFINKSNPEINSDYFNISYNSVFATSTLDDGQWIEVKRREFDKALTDGISRMVEIGQRDDVEDKAQKRPS